MQSNINPYLAMGAVLSALASLAHIGIIFGGPAWYRFFGAGERFAQAAERGRWLPAIVTFGIALVLAVWSLYGLSGAGAIGRLPLLKWALVAITCIFLLRGLAGPLMLVAKTGHSTQFVIVSSLICLGIGLMHAVGLSQIWHRL